eukprot:scaffold2621_cov124-Isochrysis_galbana.AAC.2
MTAVCRCGGRTTAAKVAPGSIHARTASAVVNQGWQERALAHLAAVRVGGLFYTTRHCDNKGKHTYLRECPTSGCCTEHIKPRDVMECLAITYGEPPAEIGGDKPWPSLRNHAAGDVWFDLVLRSFVDNEFVFSIRGTRVCAEVWRAAYNIPRSTFESICASVFRGEGTWRRAVAHDDTASTAMGIVAQEARIRAERAERCAAYTARRAKEQAVREAQKVIRRSGRGGRGGGEAPGRGRG